VARQTRTSFRAARRRQGAAANLIGLGLLFLLAPLFLGSSPVGAALRPLGNIGWLLLLAGGVFLWLLRAKPGFTAPSVPPIPVRPAPSLRPSAPPVRMADLVRTLPEVPRQEKSTAAIRTRPTAWGPGVLAAIEWRRFEALVEALFAQAGFETRSQSHGADGGVDIWLHSKHQPDGKPVSLVQCKHWQGKRVGVDKVRELRGVMAAHDVRRGQFATTSTFTPEALAFGRDNGINLLDVEGLLALIAQRTPAQQQALLDVALDGDYWRPTCVNCGTKMVERTPRKGGSAFWGCTGYPRCRTILPMRA
jgi:restriction system protein